MGHVLYGYRIENGKPVIDEEQAGRVKILFQAYLSGLTLTGAAEAAGIKKNHSAVKLLMKTRAYLGEGYYPQIIDGDTFERAGEEIRRRAEKLGRMNKAKPAPEYKIYGSFSTGVVYEKSDDHEQYKDHPVDHHSYYDFL